MHKFEKLPDKEIESVGTFEIKKCVNCGLKVSKAYFDGAIPSYWLDGSLYTKDPGCIDVRGIVDTSP